MNEKDLSEYKRKYHNFRHHAWAGLGFLSVVLAIRLLFLEQTEILTPIVVILAIYILVALLFTYIYRSGLSAPDQVLKKEPSDEIEKERINAEVEKERLKLEKKKAKAESKAKKKSVKK
jgi:hypothetical protein